MELEWDDDKRRSNLAKHGLDLARAGEVFADYRLERLDTRRDYGEDRWIAIGMLRGLAVVLVYVERVDSIRAISLRRATPTEREIYERERQKQLGSG